MNDPQPLQLRHQQGSKGIPFRAGIVGNELVGPWRIADDAKNNSPAYIEFLRLNLQLWLKKKILEFKQKVVFICNITPACTTIAIIEYSTKLTHL